MRIGSGSNELAVWLARFTQEELQQFGITGTLLQLETPAQEPLKPVQEALLHGAIDLAVFEMTALPTRQPDGLVITAVGRRTDPADLLLIRPDAFDATRVFKLREQATVGISTTIRQAQLNFYRPDVLPCAAPEEISSQLKQLHQGKYDALILAAARLQWLQPDIEGLETLVLNPREFVPAPAQGVPAWVTHRDDLPTRRALKQIHQPDVSAVTNVERKVLQLLGHAYQDALGVFVERDKAGNFHACAAAVLEGHLKQVRLSQSTSFGLAEKIVETLQHD
ncbi:MAG: hypothetical protein EP344_06655 [Bacteroidetes bacterium]|nr:MAG: hypothetical protein EP344_06655 [Bacteroidota bacterium]